MDDKTLVERAVAVPLLERLRRVPNDARLEYEHDPCHHSVFPIGAMCHEAATRIEALEADNAKLRDCLSSAVETLRDAEVCDDDCEHCNEAHKALESKP